MTPYQIDSAVYKALVWLNLLRSRLAMNASKSLRTANASAIARARKHYQVAQTRGEQLAALAKLARLKSGMNVRSAKKLAGHK
jgi:hypothetical protein